jgi:hypothetical protein
MYVPFVFWINTGTLFCTSDLEADVDGRNNTMEADANDLDIDGRGSTMGADDCKT